MVPSNWPWRGYTLIAEHTSQLTFGVIKLWRSGSMATKEPTVNANIDESTELSKKRTREAADRTLMAWIRRSLSFIAFGFGIAAIAQTLEETALENARILGVSFVAVALFAVVVAMFQYRQELKMIEADDYRHQPSLPLGILSAVALCLIGLFAIVGILIDALSG